MIFTVKYKKGSPVKKGHLNLGGENHDRKIEIGNRYLIQNGTPWIPILGEIHYCRVKEEDWETELLKMKAGGITGISCYTIWIYHEEEEGTFDFNGNKNLGKFVALCKKHGLDMVLRIGPWVHGEVRNGGFPDWLLQKECALRSNDPEYLSYVKRYYQQLYSQVKEFLFEKDGPIFAIQLENELTEDADHLLQLKHLAEEVGLKAPIYTVTGWNREFGAKIPEKEVLPVFGGYPEAPWEDHTNPLAPSMHYFFMQVRNDSSIGSDFIVRHADAATFEIPYEEYPFATCELGGAVQVTYKRRPIIHPEDTTVLSMVKLGCGNNMPGYYMYHGGTNGIGKYTTLQESKESGYPCDLPIRSYDFQAPIGEYGLIREHYRKMKLQFLFLKHFDSLFAAMDAYFPEKALTDRHDTQSLRYAVRTDGTGGFLFVNNYQRLYPLKEQKEIQFKVKTGTDTLIFPQKGISIKSGVYFMFPFGLKMRHFELCYATAQLLCQKDRTYFFFAIDGIEVEFMLKDTDIEAVQSQKDISVIQKDGTVLVKPNDIGKERKIRIVQEKDYIQIVTLTQKEAEHFYELNGEFYIGEGDLYEKDGNLVSYRLGDNDLSYFQWNGEEFVKQERIEKITEISAEYEEIEVPYIAKEVEKELLLGGEKKKRAWKISFNQDSLHRLADAFLEIDYIGDVAQIYGTGIFREEKYDKGKRYLSDLAADEFYKGEKWLVSIKKLLDYGKELYLVISELKGEQIYLETEEKEGLQLKQIRVLPLYEKSEEQYFFNK